ncbi:hypothetical protein ASG87_17535 [Frateuria sp. Soil773]|nr:hypothetical protein ASG87_17535 [Frateuria sp. Soil773]
MLGSAWSCGGLEFGHAPLQFVDLGAGARQQLALDVELFAGDQLEATQSLRQDIAKVGLQILMRPCQSWRYQRNKSQGNLVDIPPIHHGWHLELVGMKSR